MKRGRRPLGVFVTLLSLAAAAYAAAPIVTITATSARIQITAATLSDTIDTFARAAGFKVTYEGARPSAMLFNAEIDTPNVAQTLNRLLDGQNLNYGVVLDLSGTRVTSLMIFGPAPRAGFGSTAGRPQSFATPRNTRTTPAPIDDEPVEEPVAEPSPEPTPSPSPGATSTRPSPFGPRPPFGRPFGAVPTPPPAPAPSPSPSA